MTGKLPERRSNQISEIYEDSVLIFGGKDLKEGAYNTLWKLPLSTIMEGESASWELIETTGTMPPPISHHSSSLYNDTLYIYGGLVGSDSNDKIYALNLKTLEWSLIK